MALDSPIKFETLHAEHAPSPESLSDLPSVFHSYFTEFTGIFVCGALGHAPSAVLLTSAPSFRFSSGSRPIPVI